MINIKLNHRLLIYMFFFDNIRYEMLHITHSYTAFWIHITFLVSSWTRSQDLAWSLVTFLQNPARWKDGQRSYFIGLEFMVWLDNNIKQCNLEHFKFTICNSAYLTRNYTFMIFQFEVAVQRILQPLRKFRSK